MSDVISVAVAQSPADLSGPQARLAWLTAQLTQLESGAPDLLVLPELFQSGYNIGDKVVDYAEAPDGSFAREITALARQYGVAICYGYAERQGDTLYNAAQCIDASGQQIGHHRKLLLPPGFEGDHFAPGTGSSQFQIGAFTVSFLICYDVEFPENVRHVALQGADIVVVPTALGAQWGVVSEKVVPARAFENGVFLCYANSAGQEGEMAFYGGSCMIAPDGEELARAGAEPGLIFTWMEKPSVARAQTRLPYFQDRKRLPWVD